MASYGALVRMITTAEINRVQREGAYTRWAYYVDEHSGKVGVIVANDTTFAAYAVEESPDPKLTQFGFESIADLQLTPDPELLVLKAGNNLFKASVFSDPLVLFDDEFTDAFSAAVVQDWQGFLAERGAQLPHPGTVRGPRIALGIIIALIVVFVIIALI
jgi:hypothetical protein